MRHPIRLRERELYRIGLGGKLSLLERGYFATPLID